MYRRSGEMRALVLAALLLGCAMALPPVSLVMSNGRLPLVTHGVVTPTLATATDALKLPIPTSVASTDMVFLPGDTSLAYNFSFSVQLEDGTPAAFLTAGYTLPASGSLPATATTFTATYTCLQPGTAVVAHTLSVTNATSGTTEDVVFYVAKVCSGADLCDRCTATCPAGATCACSPSPTGSTCVITAAALATKATPTEGRVRTLSLSTGGALPGETDADRTARYTDLAAQLAATDVDAIALQGVFDDDIRTLLANSLKDKFPYLVRGAVGPVSAASPDSGLFIASRFLIMRTTFQSFTSGQYGALAVLLEITETAHLQLFTTQLNSATAALQSSQAKQAAAFVAAEAKGSTSKVPLGTTSVVLVGDFGVDAVAAQANGYTYTQLIADLNNARDIAGEDDKPAASTWDGTRVDYAFTYNNISKQNTRKVQNVQMSTRAFTGSSYVNQNAPLRGHLSPHAGMEYDFDYNDSSKLVEIIVPSVICGLILIGLLACFTRACICKKRIPAPTWLRDSVRQLAALLKKNWLVSLRARRALALQFVLPFIFVALLYVLQYARRQNQSTSDLVHIRTTSDEAAVPLIPRCSGDGCFTIAYSPAGDPIVEALIAIIMADQGIPSSEVRTFVDQTDANTFLVDNGPTVQAVYHVQPKTGSGNNNGVQELVDLSYTIQYNNTVIQAPRAPRPQPVYNLVLPMQVAFERAVLKYRHKYNTGEEFELDVSTLRYPHPVMLKLDIVGQSGPSFFLACLMFNFVIQMGQIVAEREHHLREAMAVVGMRDGVYWLSWVITNVFWNTLTALLLIVAGCIFQFQFFLANDFGTYFFLFFLFGVSMVPFALFFSLFLTKSSTATTVGFAIYLIGAIGLGATFAIFTDNGDANIARALALAPFIPLAKGMQDLGSATSGADSVGLRWRNRAFSSTFFPLTDCYNWMIIDFFVYMALVLLWDSVFGGTRGESRFRYWINRCTAKKAQPNAVGDKAHSGSSSDSSDSDDDHRLGDGQVDPEVEKEAQRVRKGDYPEDAAVVLQGLNRVFYNYKFGVVRDRAQDFVAVDGLWLHIDDKQLFCLLGHNGAGKTTTISMLTGLLSPTAGDARVLGKSLRGDPDEVRADMGVCPQHDILWNELTGSEHIKLFCALKGVPADRWDVEAEERLRDLGLDDVQNLYSRAYSGGQKRRLSVAIALAGSPRVVYLDEPTTGMDPVSRRQVWELLEREKRKRLIVLTTHSMEEADMLSDKIVIMKAGKIRCIGSALHLKNVYGSGYRLSVVGASVREIPAITALVTKRLPTARLDRAAASTVHYEVPAAAATTELPRFLKEVETSGQALGIIDVQIGMTSLEDVFLRVAGHGGGSNEEEPDDKKKDDDKKKADNSRASRSSSAPISRSGASTGASSGVELAVEASTAATEPDADAAGDDEEFEAVASEDLAESEQESSSASASGSDQAVTPKKKAWGTTKASGKEGKGSGSSSESKYDYYESPEIDFSEYRPSFSRTRQCAALWNKSVTLQLRQYRTNLCQMIFPLFLILVLFMFQVLIADVVRRASGSTIAANLNPRVVPIAMNLVANFDPVAECPDTPAPAVLDTDSAQMYFSFRDPASQAGAGQYGYSGADQALPWADRLESGLLGNVTKDISKMVAFRGQPRLVDQGVYTQLCYFRTFILPMTFTSKASKEELEKDLLQDFADQRVIPMSLLFDQVDVSNGRLGFGVYFNETISQGRDVPLLVNFINSAAFGMLVGSQKAQISFNGTRDYPAAAVANEYDFATLIGPIFYIFILQLYFPVVLGGLVYEKEFKLREIMRMMGLKTEVYWLVNYVIYYALYLLAILVMLGVGAALELRMMTINGFGPLIIFVLLWGHVMMGMSFFCSAFFSKANSGTIFGYIYIFGVTLLNDQLIQVYYEGAATTENTIKGLMVFPAFTLYRGLLLFRQYAINNGPGASIHDLVPGNEMVEVYIYFVVQWAVLMIAALYLELVLPDGNGVKRSPIFCFKPSFWCPGRSRRDKQVSDEHSADEERAPEVAREAKRAYSEHQRSRDMIRIQGLRKVYQGSGNKEPIVAVDKLSMGIGPGECYGMLGPNGSGKSTTINVLCGFFAPTKGTAQIADLDITADMDTVHLILGVCPQENLIWNELTGYEHMVFYGKLKGITNKKKLDEEIEARLAAVDLFQWKDRRAGRYSGGMKRRLCVAIALIGTPPVVLLDEPTTGLDPKARNNLWEVVRAAKKDSCVMLTTHSMEEAEALCERVGIFVKGNLRTIGTPAQLKHGFGAFYKITVTLPAADMPDMQRRISELAPAATIFNEPVPGTVIYQLPRGSTPLSEVFQAVAGWAKDGNILDWGIANVSLEEVFLRVVGEMEPEADPNNRVRSVSAASVSSNSGSGSESA